jgi:hypothetical protein
VREGEHRSAAKGLVDLQGPEVKAAVAKAKKEQERADSVTMQALEHQHARCFFEWYSVRALKECYGVPTRGPGLKAEQR